MIKNNSMLLRVFIVVINLILLTSCSDERSTLVESGVQNSTIRLYYENCLICHGAKGLGHGKAAIALAKPLSPFVSSSSDRSKYDVISNGLGQMPAWASHFTSFQINELVIYIDYLAMLNSMDE